MKNDNQREEDHITIYGCTKEDMNSAIKADESGWLESDYQVSLSLFRKLHKANPALSDLFIAEVRNLEDIDCFPINIRCRLIYFLLSTHIDWRDTYHQNISLSFNATFLQEKVYSKEPTINIDFQHITNQINQFDPSADQLEAWADIFGNALKHHQVQPEVSSGIVRDAGKMRKRRQK